MKSSQFIAAILGESKGYLCIGRRDPHLPKGHKDRFKEEYFAYPADLGKALSRIEALSPDYDVYFCPAVLSKPKRNDANVKSVRAISFELDKAPDNRDFFNQLPKTLVASGTKGHHHVYIPLKSDTTPAEAREIARKLARALGVRTAADGGKTEPSGFLRVPGTLNHKPDGEPAAVAVTRTSRRKTTIEGLSRLLSVFLIADDESHAHDATGTDIVPERVGKDVRRKLRDDLNRETGDRSGDIFSLVATCREHGLTQGQALTLALEYPPAQDKWHNDPAKIAADVDRIWARQGNDDSPFSDPAEDRETLRKKLFLAFDRAVITKNLMDIPSMDEPIWGEGKYQLWSPGDPLHIWGKFGTYKTGAFGIPVAAYLSGAARKAKGYTELWGYPLNPLEGKVAYLAWDRQKQLERAAARYSHHLGVDLGKWIHFIEYSRALKAYLLDNPELVIDYLVSRNISAVIVDSLQNAIGFSFTEEVLERYLEFQKLASKANINVATINHALKDVYYRGSFQQNTYRGSAAILDQTGTSFQIVRAHDDEEASYLKVVMEKAAVEFIPDVHLRYDKKDSHPHVVDTTPAEEAKAREIDFSKPGRQAVPVKDRKEKIIAYLAENGPTSQNQLRKGVRMSPKAVQDLTRELVEEGVLVRDERKRLLVNIETL